DLTILENCADRNARFRKLQDVVLSLPDLSDEEIDESYSELKSSSHPAEMLHKLFMKHEILEPFAS
ncbi:MAG: hypothetical protein H8D23_38860, partial [Candidatus Brocadiales bacterium]|nr:hypothetical protein [Candidatus Brocadiales bacterium]